MENLKPCPFCGSQAAFHKIGGGLGPGTGWFNNGDWVGIVTCERCHASIDFRGKESELEKIAVQKWNCRVSMEIDTSRFRKAPPDNKCHTCQYWDDCSEDEKEQYCDLKEEYTGPGGWCARYTERSR